MILVFVNISIASLLHVSVLDENIPTPGDMQRENKSAAISKVLCKMSIDLGQILERLIVIDIS